METKGNYMSHFSSLTVKAAKSTPHAFNLPRFELRSLVFKSQLVSTTYII